MTTPTTDEQRLPWPGLLVLVTIAFIAVVSELMPAGLLSPMAASLDVSESGAGVLVTVYALSAGIATIPVIAFTRSVSRFRLMLVTTLGFGLANLGTAFIDSYAVMVAIRLLGGVFTGMLWSLVGGYAAQLVPAEQRGRAVSIALGGATIGFSIGLPAATALGQLVGWRGAFAVVGVLSLATVAAAVVALPRVPGEPPHGQLPFLTVLRLPGIAAIAAVVVALIVGHYTLYTYVDPFVRRAGLGDGVSVALFLFGGGTVLGIALTARVIDRLPREALLLDIAVIAGVMVLVGVAGRSAGVVLVGALVWGVAYGGLSPIIQSQAVRIGGAAADVAVSVIVTAWSFGIAVGALVGGAVLDGPGLGALPWVAAALMAAALAGVAAASRHAFPRHV